MACQQQKCIFINFLLEKFGFFDKNVLTRELASTFFVNIYLLYDVGSTNSV